jgi:hypothetical protein
MTMRQSLATLLFVSTLLLGFNANAQNSCVFFASQSTYYNTSYPSGSIYAYGAISFVWEPSSGRILSGYYPERVVQYTPVLTHFNNVASGSITAGPVGGSLNHSLSMTFTRSVPVSYGMSLTQGSLTGSMTSATFTGMLDGPYLIEATGIVTCQ